MSVEFANESGVEVPADLVIAAARFAVEAMDVHPAAELSLLCVDESTMTDLHVQWMDLPGPTDVMSFPMDELVPGGRPDAADPGPAILGDIVLCPEFAARQAKDARRSFENELVMLTVHGVLHLLGYDHAEPQEKAEMFGLQQTIMDGFYEHRRDQERARRQTDRDTRLLSNIGFTEPAEATGDITGGEQSPDRGRGAGSSQP
ncbi:MAG: rRNA maturation RNase YbeY [Gordonia sp. (in: high G+C Gram-positive bacteria)]